MQLIKEVIFSKKRFAFRMSFWSPLLAETAENATGRRLNRSDRRGTQRRLLCA